MAVEDLKEQIARLPEQPGVYVWANATGETLYVGKARSLRDRVRNYLGAQGFSPRHDALLEELARKTMGLTHRLFGIRSCNEVITGHRGRPCLEYDIKRCIAPCVVELCTAEQYGVAVANTRLLLEGRNDELIDTLRDRMVDASEAERYEEAAQLRDAMRTVQTLRYRQQKVATAQLGDRDVFGLKVGPSGGVIQVFAMRGGRVVERVELSTDPGGLAARDADVLEAALQQFYELRVPPSEINLP